MTAICLILDITLAKGIGTTVPEHLKSELWQSFSGTIVDWICIVVLNVFWLAVAVMQVFEIELYAKKVVDWVVAFLATSIIALLLIRYC